MRNCAAPPGDCTTVPSLWSAMTCHRFPWIRATLSARRPCSIGKAKKLRNCRAISRLRWHESAFTRIRSTFFTRAASGKGKQRQVAALHNAIAVNHDRRVSPEPFAPFRINTGVRPNRSRVAPRGRSFACFRASRLNDRRLICYDIRQHFRPRPANESRGLYKFILSSPLHSSLDGIALIVRRV